MTHINWAGLSNNDLGTHLRYLYERLVNDGLASADELDALQEAFTRIEELGDEEG